MVRSTHFLRIVEEENLVENAAKVGARIVESLHEIAAECPMISAVRGRGLFIAFDLPDPKTRDEFWKGLFDRGAAGSESRANARFVSVPRSIFRRKSSTKRWNCCASNASRCANEVDRALRARC